MEYDALIAKLESVDIGEAEQIMDRPLIMGLYSIIHGDLFVQGSTIMRILAAAYYFGYKAGQADQAQAKADDSNGVDWGM